MSTHPLYLLAARFPQLCIPLSNEAKDSSLYKDLVLRGRKSVFTPDGYSLSTEDKLKSFPTPVGEAEVLCLQERADFERCVCALAYRCAPKSIPPSMGATTIHGLIDWGKIRANRAAYEAAGGQAWQEEFKRFTADTANYLSTLILVSRGFYSAVPPEKIGLTHAEWLQKSLTVRTYHELTHFVCRRWYPQDVEPIRDEVIADAVGLVAAFGVYDPPKAALFLGVESEQYRPGGRLENYQTEDQSLAEAIDTAHFWLHRAEAILGDTCYEDPFAPLPALMGSEAGNQL